MKKEFNLSEKKRDMTQAIRTVSHYMYSEEDVKEFLRLLKEEKIDCTTSRKRWLNNILNKLAGNSLIELKGGKENDIY